MQPIKVTQIGTGISSPFIMDIFQNPTTIGCAVSATNATYSVEVNYDWNLIATPTWNGTAGVWWPLSVAMQTTAASTTAGFTQPVAAIRLNVLQAANATAQAVMYLNQASNAP